MKRTFLLNKLAAYKPEAREEQQYKQDMIAFINQHADCFERSLAMGHITASAWLVNKEGTKALLMHHTKLDKWFQLGGHSDGDSNTLAVALKEAQEESGIFGIEPMNMDIFDIDIHLIPGNSKEAEHYHYDVRFLLRVASDEQLVQNRESKELRWIGKDRAELPTESLSVVRMFDKWVNQR